MGKEAEVVSIFVCPPFRIHLNREMLCFLPYPYLVSWLTHMERYVSQRQGRLFRLIRGAQTHRYYLTHVFVCCRLVSCV